MKKVSSEWIKEYDCKIIDPNGWDRQDYDYSFKKEKITRQEFEQRLIMSKIQGMIYSDKHVKEYKRTVLPRLEKRAR